MQEYDVNSFLEKLGLTEYEAKTLSALFNLREAEAPEISRLAQVPKTRVYDVLDRLTNKGLIIEIYGRPKKYRVVEPEKVFSELIAWKKNELRELEDTAKKMGPSIAVEISNGKREKVMKVKDLNDFLRILSQEVSGAKKQVIGFTGIGKEFGLLNEAIKNVPSKNIEVKLISKILDADKTMVKEMSGAGVLLKHFDHGLHAYVIDGKKVILALSDFAQHQPEYHFTIWPENKTMANALQKYFDHCWQQGKNI